MDTHGFGREICDSFIYGIIYGDIKLIYIMQRYYVIQQVYKLISQHWDGNRKLLTERLFLYFPFLK